MRRTKLAVSGIALLAAAAMALSACVSSTSCGDATSGTGGASQSSSSTDAAGGTDAPAESSASSEAPAEASTAIIRVNGSEPENKLIPSNTNEVGGGKILDSLFEGLAYYDATGKLVNGLAESITVDDPSNLTIKLTSPVAADFAQRLGYSAFYPLPDVAFDDVDKFGEAPIGSGPYKLAGDTAWQHDVQIDLVANPDYTGGRKAANSGLTIVFYATQEAAYADLQSGNVDVSMLSRQQRSPHSSRISATAP